MTRYLSIALTSMLLMFNACSNGQEKDFNLSAADFAAKIKEMSSSPVIDVRTPEEFENGHIENAKNIDWRGDDFESKVSALDKSTPVFVYCLSGGRSSSAASKMRSMGFKQVFELDGGMMKWRAAGLPETTASNSASTGMTKQQYDELLNTDKMVLVDFYAEWCAPCKKMAPYFEEIKKEAGDKVTVVRINVDENKTLAKALKIEELPVLMLYKNKEIAWRNSGYISKEDIVKQLK